MFNKIEEALEAFKLGNPILVVDDESRENEGDIIFAASKATQEKLNLCAKEAKGLVCIAMDSSIAKRLDLKPVSSNHLDPFHTAFHDSIDAMPQFVITTGISAKERAITAALVADPNSKPNDFIKPGHLFPVVAKRQGVLVRQGHTEAAVDLCKLTEQESVAIICEVMDADGNMMRRDGLFEFAKNLEIFSSVYKEVGEHYVDDIPPGELIKTAISSMLKSLDPYTVFFSEYQAEEALIERHGEYGGVGARIQFRNKQPIVTEIIKGYGFHKAGILLGDQILKIDNTKVSEFGHEDLMPLFRGAPNTQFKIQLVRGNDTLIKTVSRSSIETKSVSYAGMIDDNTGYIKLDEFGNDCSREIETELKKLQQNPKFNGLVLYLRNNGEG